MSIYLGLMSGTSMDGIDAALLDLSSNKFLQGLTYPYSPSVANQLKKAMTGEPNHLSFFSQLNTLVGREFAEAALELLRESHCLKEDVIAIGSHGQTIAHDSRSSIPYTVQLGCGHTIAERTGIKVVADFRTRDLIVGGQGAPFAPIFHQALFSQYEHPLAVVNIGGIANLTVMSSENHVLGYDLGPGNCLLDAWISKHRKQPYDLNGRWAGEGRVIESLLRRLLSDPYFRLPAPKSIGKEYFSLEWLQAYLKTSDAAEDVQATLVMLTAEIIAEGIKRQTEVPESVFICGGGAHNTTLMSQLSSLLTGMKVQSTQVAGINPDFVEACMCAWLAEKTIRGVPLDLRKITGAKRPAILGAVYPGW